MKRKLFIGYYNRSVILTYIGVSAGLLSIILSTNHQFKYAAILIIISGICDLFDGWIARKVKRTSNEKLFGIEIDSLCDTVSFCLAPVLFFYMLSYSGWYFVLIYVALLIAGITRLAYFSVNAKMDGAKGYYLGLPVTFTALIAPLVFWFISFFHIGSYIFVAAIISLTAIFFVLNIKIKKPTGFAYLAILFLSILLSIAIYYI